VIKVVLALVLAAAVAVLLLQLLQTRPC